jgi:hypothetical protein
MLWDRIKENQYNKKFNSKKSLKNVTNKKHTWLRYTSNNMPA